MKDKTPRDRGPSIDFVVKCRMVNGNIEYLSYRNDQLSKARRAAEHRQDVDMVLWCRSKAEIMMEIAGRV